MVRRTRVADEKKNQNGDRSVQKIFRNQAGRSNTFL
jgi:hypothetical protein